MKKIGILSIFVMLFISTVSSTSEIKPSCEFVNGSCCLGGICSVTLISCVNPNASPVVIGCDENCVGIPACEKNLKYLKTQKISDLIVKVDGLDKILDKPNNYNLRNYISRLNIIRNYFNKDNISTRENKNYNENLKNTLKNLKSNLNIIKKDLNNF